MTQTAPGSDGIVVLGAAAVCAECVHRSLELPPGSPAPSITALTCPPDAGLQNLSPALARRFGNAQRFALAASTTAAAQAGWTGAQAGRAICVGTGLGSLTETYAFVENLIRMAEREPRPAAFAGSVHNAIAARIAVAFKCAGENHTFVQSGISFDLALWQAITLLQRGRADQVLVCGADELHPVVAAVELARGHLAVDGASRKPMDHDSAPRRGCCAGEGAAAFVLAKPSVAGTSPRLARVLAVKARPVDVPGSHPPSPDRERQFVTAALASAGRSLDDVGFILCGANGDSRIDAVYLQIVEALSAAAHRPIRYGVFKHRCGEYCTASAIGLATAVSIVNRQTIPPGVERGELSSAALSPAGVLLYNLPDIKYHSTCLVVP